MTASKGQVLARLDAKAYAGRVGEAGREAAALRAMAGPPSIEETTARLKQAQDSEQEMVRHIALARHDEDLKQKAREERVAEHVRAQLALRTLDSQGGERAVGGARTQPPNRLKRRPALPRKGAIVDFEQVSLVRAAIDQELARVRAEALRYKQLASNNRYAPKYVAGALGAAMNAVPQNAVDGNLYAPQDGRILPRHRHAGAVCAARGARGLAVARGQRRKNPSGCWPSLRRMTPMPSNRARNAPSPTTTPSLKGASTTGSTRSPCRPMPLRTIRMPGKLRPARKFTCLCA